MIKKISNFKFQISNFGFTLIELLVVVAVMAIMGGVVANLFFQILKGATKAQLSTEIKQNGDYTLSLMGKMIRNAKQVTSECKGEPADAIVIQNQDDKLTTFACLGTGDEVKIASNSERLTSSKVRVSSSCQTFVKCTKTGLTPSLIEISFSLSQLGSPTRPEEAAAVDFKTSVSLRTY